MRTALAARVLAIPGLLGLTTALADQTAQCVAQELQRKAPAGTTIASAAVVAASERAPQHCLVKGTVATPGNTVDFQLGLPEQWNGRFYFQGVGGFAGSMGSLNSGLERGYATATTDTGHQGGGTDAVWALNNRAKEIDYGHRGTHVSVVAAKNLTGAYFGAAPKYSYFNGCSNGGRQALMEAQRYPEDFDGIVAGDPSLGGLGYVRRLINYQHMLSSPAKVLPSAKLDMLSKAVVAACDKSDGLADGVVGDPRHCKFDPQPLLCKGADGPECLTAPQLATLKFMYDDAKTPQGERLYGFPVGHEAGSSGWTAWITGRTPPTPRADGKMEFVKDGPSGYRFVDGFFRYMAFEQDNPDYDWHTFDLKRDLSKIKAMMEIVSPTTDVANFQKKGGKLLMYHGWADPALSAYATIAYYDEVVRKAGGKSKADNSVRLFLAPGMHHCSGGPGPNSFDEMTALEQWVEKGVAPTQLIASHSTDGKVDRTRPLCPEPQVARYTGTGSIDAAENFRCETPSRR